MANIDDVCLNDLITAPAHLDPPRAKTTGAIPTRSGGPAPGVVRRDAWHLPGLNGLRGIAVLAVVAYHLGYLPGGFVGVDLFFVLSGFLITSLLLRDPPEGRRQMTSWWARRVRRLTPAVAVVVLAVLVLFLTRSGIALDAFATMTWWQNWHLVIEGTPYWAGSPSPLRHAWSLSIEEQFYLVWPLVLLATLAVGRRIERVRNRNRVDLRRIDGSENADGRPDRPTVLVAFVAAVGGLASFAWAAHLAGAETVDLSRVYFGTDTRAGALLAGCALAAWMQRHPRRWDRPGSVPDPLGVAALVAGGTLAVLCVLMTPDVRWAYRGGLALAAASSLVLVGACTGPGPVGTALSWQPLQWLGTRSYAIYLWSWPTQVALQERAPGLPLAVVAATTVAASIALAEVSMRAIERPLRYRRGWAAPAIPRRAAWAGGTVALVVVGLIAASSTVQTSSEQLAEQFEKVPDPATAAESHPTAEPQGADVRGAPSTTSPPTTACVPVTGPALQFAGGGGAFDPSTVSDVADPTGNGCGSTRVMVVGDSTGRGAANGLRRNAGGALEVWDRTVLGCGLQATKAKCPNWRTIWPTAVQQVAPQTVLVHLGVSDDLIDGREPGFMTPEASQIRQQVLGEAMDALRSGGARVVWVLPSVPTDQGTFYCGGARKGTGCDPAWISRWNADVSAAAVPRGVAVVDLDAWVASRGRAKADRPDGLHLSGSALDAEAGWLAPQLR